MTDFESTFCRRPWKMAWGEENIFEWLIKIVNKDCQVMGKV